MLTKVSLELLQAKHGVFPSYPEGIAENS